MSNLTRRQFLRVSALATAGAALAACGSKSTTEAPAPTQPPAGEATQAPVEQQLSDDDTVDNVVQLRLSKYVALFFVTMTLPSRSSLVNGYSSNPVMPHYNNGNISYAHRVIMK